MTEVAPPSGQLPPADLRLTAGDVVALAPPAKAACDRHLRAHPEELERYGPHARTWCVHDLQWLLLWALQDADGQGVDLGAQLDWLARVLGARGYALASLAEAVETLAGEAGHAGAAERLRAGAARLRGPLGGAARREVVGADEVELERRCRGRPRAPPCSPPPSARRRRRAARATPPGACRAGQLAARAALLHPHEALRAAQVDQHVAVAAGRERSGCSSADPQLGQTLMTATGRDLTAPRGRNPVR